MPGLVTAVMTLGVPSLHVLKPFVLPFLVRLAAAFCGAFFLVGDVEPAHWTWYARLGSCLGSLVVIGLLGLHASSACMIPVGSAAALVPAAARRFLRARA